MKPAPPWLWNLRVGSGIALFLLISGVLPWIAPFGVLAQWWLVLHIVLGLLATVVFTRMFWRHGRIARQYHPGKLWREAGNWAMLGWLLAAGTGLGLLAWGLFRAGTPYRLHVAHIALSLGLGAILALHVVRGLMRSSFARRYGTVLTTAALGIAVFAAGAGLVVYGRWNRRPAQGDFSPSNARTSTGKVIPASLLAGSASCGNSGCHTTIYREWQPSAHRYSAIDPFYETVKANYRRDRGANAARYCAGCHEPVTLLAGQAIPVHDTLPGGSEGSSCAFCHLLRHAAMRGNANYVVHAPTPYLFELSPHPWLRRVSDVLIRLHPEQHNRDFQVDKETRSAEYCGSCHKQYIDKRENGWGFVQLQDQYDDWKNGPWHTDPARNLTCEDCHMHLVKSDDPARNAQGYIHDHRILASNNYAPRILHLPGAARQIALVEQWMKGETVIPEIQKVWPAGPIMALHLQPQGTVAPGRTALLRAVMVNRKVGHAFPTGPLDVNEAWLELQVKDANGHVIYSTGTVGPDKSIQGKTVEYRSYLLDRNGNPVFTHSLWNVVGARDKRVVIPGEADMTEFHVPIPRQARGPFSCRLRLLYRRFNGQAQKQLFPPGFHPHIPVLTIASTTISMPLSGHGPATTGTKGMVPAR